MSTAKASHVIFAAPRQVATAIDAINARDGGAPVQWNKTRTAGIEVLGGYGVLAIALAPFDSNKTNVTLELTFTNRILTAPPMTKWASLWSLARVLRTIQEEATKGIQVGGPAL